eukprot:7109854-Alexandrium_andersonii.AAC.1
MGDGTTQETQTHAERAQAYVVVAMYLEHARAPSTAIKQTLCGGRCPIPRGRTKLCTMCVTPES